jgi:hypothetical protein
MRIPLAFFLVAIGKSLSASVSLPCLVVHYVQESEIDSLSFGFAGGERGAEEIR